MTLPPQNYPPQVRKALLHFIEMLGRHDYLAMPQGNIIINYVIKLSESACSVSRGQAGRGQRVAAREGQVREHEGKKKRVSLAQWEGALVSKTLSSEPGEALNQKTQLALVSDLNLFLFQNEEDIQRMCSEILQMVQAARVKEAPSSPPLLAAQIP